MKKVISSEKIPIKLWLDNIEDGALEQAKNLANLPFAYKWISIMPDSHQGFGMPIGGVMATKNVIVSNAVGVDIGCGMCAVKTSLTEIDTDTLKKIMGGIRKAVPVGFAHHKEKQDESLMPDRMAYGPDVFDGIIQKEYQNALTQIGTLGGGNHFIEIQKGSDGHIWIMIHSGSRNIGKQIADYYDKLAIKLNEKWNSSVPKEWQLAFLPIESEEGQAYLREMNYAVDFALANRKLMMDRIKNVFVETFFDSGDKLCPKFDEMINIAHNYASLENHFGENVWVHRKGATLARKGTIGIIPGSMGTKSYIVEGLGNKDSFESCSHGAGRKMGRKEAIRTLNLEEEQKKMEGIIGSPRNQNDLEEAPGAYKLISEVMANQSDLVRILIELTPLANIKG
jgi:tRNA-splicing ligase RtcB